MGVKSVAISISSHKQTQLNCFLILYDLSIFGGSVFPDYLDQGLSEYTLKDKQQDIYTQTCNN